MTTSSPQREGLLQRVVGWLRAGYPEGVPQQDYVALLGILQRALTPTEVERVVQDLSDDAESGQAIITRALVKDRIEDVVKGPAAAEDVGAGVAVAVLGEVMAGLVAGSDLFDVLVQPARSSDASGTLRRNSLREMSVFIGKGG